MCPEYASISTVKLMPASVDCLTRIVKLKGRRAGFQIACRWGKPLAVGIVHFLPFDSRDLERELLVSRLGAQRGFERKERLLLQEPDPFLFNHGWTEATTGGAALQQSEWKQRSVGRRPDFESLEAIAQRVSRAKKSVDLAGFVGFF